MKKFYCLILGIAIYQSGFTQIVIDGTGFISPGTMLNYENASPMWLLNQDVLNTSGENAVWNVDSWQFLNNTVEIYGAIDTLPFVNQLVFGNQFLYPASFSTVVLPVGQNIIDLPLPLDISDGYSYFRKDETGYYNTGTSFQISGFPLTTPNDSVERIYKFPMHYGDTDTTALAYFINLPTIGAYGQHGKRVTEVDGAGILNTPYGTYNVLRVRAVLNTSDTLYVDQIGIGQNIQRPEQVDYIWLSPDVEGPVMKMSVINGIVISTQLLNDDITSVNTQNYSDDFSVFPNPAHSYISINAAVSGQVLNIYDARGRCVLSQKRTGNSVDVRTLNSGIYFLEVEFGDGQRQVTKFVKAR